MFGGFTLTWNGKRIAGGAKYSETQFTLLMQILLHNRDKGVDREKLVQVLFEEREIEDINHAARTIIYNAKMKLRAAGLPDVDYIRKYGGKYYWTEDIPVLEDTSEFERLYQQTKGEGTVDERLEYCLEACRIYAGEFLPTQAGVVWAAQEAKRYRAMFCGIIEQAVQLMRTKGDYIRMEELGLYATKISPLSDWETVTMEALVAQGRYDDAKRLYDDTVEEYIQKQGLRPSRRLMELLNRLGEQLESKYAVLDDIQNKLSEDSAGAGGFFCTYPVFQGIYRMVERMMERGGQSVYLMLCTVVDSKGNPMKDGQILDELSKRLGEAISSSVRRTDAINRYGKGQYLVLLINTTRENCGIVQKRINYRFLVGRQRTGVHYYVNSVICEPNKRPPLTGGEG